jgi:excisionase family DNA binding protein
MRRINLDQHQPRPNKHRTMETATLTPRQAAAYCGFGINYTYKLLRAGKMPSIREGFRFKIPRNALQRWLDSAGTLTFGGETRQ